MTTETASEGGRSGWVYPNFPDPHLDEWDPTYYGHNYERLQQIKASYDSSDYFCSDAAPR
jgi:hypothetical protein